MNHNSILCRKIGIYRSIQILTPQDVIAKPVRTLVVAIRSLFYEKYLYLLRF